MVGVLSARLLSTMMTAITPTAIMPPISMRPKIPGPRGVVAVEAMYAVYVGSCLTLKPLYVGYDIK